MPNDREAVLAALDDATKDTGVCASSYEVNVSKDGRHFFATHERSGSCAAKAAALFETLRQKFPKSEGYEVQMSAQVSYGVTLAL